MEDHHDNIYSHPKHSCQILERFLCCFKPSSSSPLDFYGWIKKITPAVKTVETAYFWNHEGSYYDAIPPVWKKTTVIKRREVMYVIDRFTAETPHDNSPWTKQNALSLVCFVSLDQIPKIKICHMVASEHPEVIEERRQLIAT